MAEKKSRAIGAKNFETEINLDDSLKTDKDLKLENEPKKSSQIKGISLDDFDFSSDEKENKTVKPVNDDIILSADDILLPDEAPKSKRESKPQNMDAPQRSRTIRRREITEKPQEEPSRQIGKQNDAASENDFIVAADAPKKAVTSRTPVLAEAGKAGLEIEKGADSMPDNSKKQGFIKSVKRDMSATGNAKDKKGGVNSWGGLVKSIVFHMISLLVSIGIMVGVGYMAYKYIYKHYFTPVDPDSTEQVEVYIKKNDSLKTISAKLEEAGVIRSKTIFKYYVDFSDMSSKILSGKFMLSPNMTYDDIINVLKSHARVQNTTRLTFREGILIKEMFPVLEDSDVLDHTNVFADKVTTAKDFSNYWFVREVIEKDKAAVNHRPYILEGYLFPDTYEFYLETDSNTVLQKLLARFNEVYTDEYKTRAKQLGMTTDEVIILASIIEKEGGKVEDFKKISAIFHNRLNTNMKLQSCATHQYFMPVKKFTYNSEELKIDSPYNTYLYGGLPIGPICNPGKAAIEAALWPDEDFVKGKYLYFCAGDPAKGETLFAKTYEEHQKNVAYAKQFWPD